MSMKRKNLLSIGQRSKSLQTDENYKLTDTEQDYPLLVLLCFGKQVWTHQLGGHSSTAGPTCPQPCETYVTTQAVAPIISTCHLALALCRDGITPVSHALVALTSGLRAECDAEDTSITKSVTFIPSQCTQNSSQAVHETSQSCVADSEIIHVAITSPSVDTLRICCFTFCQSVLT